MQIRAFYDYKLLSDAVDGIVLSSETGAQYRNNEVVFTAGMCYIRDGTGHLCKCTCRDAGYILSHTGFDRSIGTTLLRRTLSTQERFFLLCHDCSHTNKPLSA